MNNSLVDYFIDISFLHFPLFPSPVYLYQVLLHCLWFHCLKRGGGGVKTEEDPLSEDFQRSSPLGEFTRLEKGQRGHKFWKKKPSSLKVGRRKGLSAK